MGQPSLVITLLCEAISFLTPQIHILIHSRVDPVHPTRNLSGSLFKAFHVVPTTVPICIGRGSKTRRPVGFYNVFFECPYGTCHWVDFALPTMSLNVCNL